MRHLAYATQSQEIENGYASRQIRVLHGFSSFERGGQQVRVARLIGSLGARFHHVVTAVDDCFDAASLLDASASVELRRMNARRGGRIANVPAMRALIAELRPDVIFSYGWGGFEWVLANLRSPVAHYHVEEGFSPPETERRLWRRSATRAAALRVGRARLVVVSRTLADIARREWHVPRHKLIEIPNGIEFDRYANAQQRQRPSRFSRAGEPVVGAVAGMRSVKRLDRLVDAVALCHAQGVRLRAVIAGDGELRAALEQRARDRGVAGFVEFLGFVPSPAELYPEFDIAALTSDSEQMPFCVLEAMASALPVVATDVGDTRFMLPAAGHGPQVVQRDAAAVAHALATLARQPELRRRLGLANLRESRRFYSQQQMFERWERLFEVPLAAGGQARAARPRRGPSPRSQRGLEHTEPLAR